MIGVRASHLRKPEVPGSFDRARRQWLDLNRNARLVSRLRRTAHFTNGRLEHALPSLHRTAGGVGYNRLSRLARRLRFTLRY